jgi:exonuclease SbcC
LKASYTNIKNDLDKYRTLKDAKESIKSFLDVLKVYLQTKANLENKKEERIRFQPQTSILDYKTSLARNWELANSIIENANIEILDFEAQLATSENNFDTLNKKLLSKIQELGFASIEDLSSLLLNDDDAAQIRRQSKEIEDLKTELNINKGNNQTSLQAAISNDDASITIEETKEKLNALVEDNRNHLQQVGEFKGVIKLNQENKKRVEVLLDDLKKVKEQCYYYDILDELVGDQTGNKFNKLIQRITLRKLFVMTNEKLMNLMDRYQLALGGEGLEDEIWVIDTYMGDEKRSISSVSGGERFVISLAMALSLSDLASNNVRIDSLFIDEGFGSLSPDELDNAVSMLENLQAANDKTIGIISHVESLKERISTQIQVKKLHNGESTLNLKVNDKITSLTI